MIYYDYLSCIAISLKARNHIVVEVEVEVEAEVEVEVEEVIVEVVEVEVCVCCNSSQCFPHNKTNSPSVTDPGLLETALMNRHNSLTYLSLT